MALIYTAITPILPLLAQHLGGGVTGALSAQLIMAVPGIGLMVGGPLTGWGLERIGPRPLLLAAFGLYALAGSAGLYLDSAGAFLLSRWVLGVAAAGIGTSTLTLLAQALSGPERARLVGYQMALGAATGVLSTLASGAVSESGGWRAPFAFYLLVLIVLLIAVWVVPVSTRPVRSVEAATGPLRTLGRVYLCAVPLYAAVFVTSTQVVFILGANGVIHPSGQAPIVALASVFNAVGAWNYGRLRGWVGPARTFQLSVLLLASGHLMLGASHAHVDAALGCALAGLGAGILIPHLMNRVLDEAPAPHRGRAIGLLYSAQYLGSFLNPIVFAPFTALLGIHATLALSGSVLLLTAIAVEVRRRGGRAVPR
jgi:MFS family permease